MAMYDEEPYDDQPAEVAPAIVEASGIDTTRARRVLLPWLRDLVNSLEQEEPLTIVLSQVTSLGGPKGVTKIAYDYERMTVEQCIDRALMAAVNDMEGGNFKTTVAYALSVEGREGRQNFTLVAPRRTGHDHERRRDYHPDMPGLTAQLMEQNLQLTDRALDSAGASTATLERIIERQDQEIRFLRQGQIDRDIQIQELLNASLKRRMLYEEHEAKIQQGEKFAEGFKAMAPGLAATLGGEKWAAATALFLQQAGGPSSGGLAMAGMAGQPPTDEDIVDELVLRLERNPQVRDNVLQALMPLDDTVQLLAELFRRSSERRVQRARMQQSNGGGGDGNGN